MAGVGVRAVYRWLERGRAAADLVDDGEPCPEGDEDYLKLFRDVERAMAIREQELLDEIDGEEKAGQWMRQAWKLERRDPENWGPPATRMVVEGAIEHTHTLELPEETAKKMHELFHEMSKPKELPAGDVIEAEVVGES
jgi:hypothetical protein